MGKGKGKVDGVPVKEKEEGEIRASLRCGRCRGRMCESARGVGK